MIVVVRKTKTGCPTQITFPITLELSHVPSLTQLVVPSAQVRLANIGCKLENP